MTASGIMDRSSNQTVAIPMDFCESTEKPMSAQHTYPADVCSIGDTWYYPPDLKDDLKDVCLPESTKQEVFACAWEYARCVIPSYSNWQRYVSFMRIIVIGTVAEFRGELVDISAGDSILGYNLSDLLASLFSGTPGHTAMAQEFHTFLLITSEKASERRYERLFTNYVESLAQNPRQWFRMRDADALARFAIAAALACNDIDDVWFSEEQFQILTEIADVMYDSVAFFKHRSEGETNSTFAYVPDDTRSACFRQARESLWALDVAWAGKSEMATIINFIRQFGGPIHMTMRRYRFVEEDLTIGRLEDASVIAHARSNMKLWNRVDDGDSDKNTSSTRRYEQLLARQEELMYPGLAQSLENKIRCADCEFRGSYGAKLMHQFGGVRLCKKCQTNWREYALSLSTRAQEVFPEMYTAKELC